MNEQIIWISQFYFVDTIFCLLNWKLHYLWMWLGSFNSPRYTFVGCICHKILLVGWRVKLRCKMRTGKLPLFKGWIWKKAFGVTHASFCTVKVKQPRNITRSKTHFWWQGDFVNSLGCKITLCSTEVGVLHSLCYTVYCNPHVYITTLHYWE